MEIIPFLIFGYVAFQIFKGFTKASGGDSGGSAKSMMQNLHNQIEKASAAQNNTPNMSRYREKSPTQRGRESLSQKGGNSPWGENGSVAPGARVAANHLQKTQRDYAGSQIKQRHNRQSARQSARIASHKSPIQRGRHGQNMDQNRNRTDGWGQRGDKGMANGKTFLILLVLGGGILYALSNMPA